MSAMIHKQRQRKMQPFYWILTFEMITLGMLVGLALAVGPLFLLSRWPSGWMLLTLPAVPAGVWIFYKLFKNLAERIWLNRHLDQYMLYDDRVEFLLWNRETKEAIRGSVPVRDIKEMYYGRHLMLYSYAYREMKMTESAPMAELLPVLHLIYNEGLKDRLLAIPFIDIMEANRWLEVLAPRGIPLWLSSLLIHDPQDESAPAMLREDMNRVPAEFDGNIEREFRPYMERKIQEQEEREPTPEELEEEIRQREYIENERKRKAAFPNIGPFAWLTFLLQYGLGWWIFDKAASGDIETAGPIYPMSLMLVTSVIFFVLVKRMRWLQMLIFQGISFATLFILDLQLGSWNENDPLYDTGGSLLGSVFLYTAFIWIPYLILKFLRRRRDADDRPSGKGGGEKTEQGESVVADQSRLPM
ncbi:hypothetical protein [Paenibacillus sp. DMB20]|uniref:hypothetical protein n=1 Tax=Paenibacillus sp. DMB20 TaxID=1642570 RepID=UPI00069B25B0|nr:hypothetical protein [Paenibacillus sp. DMB20]